MEIFTFLTLMTLTYDLRHLPSDLLRYGGTRYVCQVLGLVPGLCTNTVGKKVCYCPKQAKTFFPINAGQILFAALYYGQSFENSDGDRLVTNLTFWIFTLNKMLVKVSQSWSNLVKEQCWSQ